MLTLQAVSWIAIFAENHLSCVSRGGAICMVLVFTGLTSLVRAETHGDYVYSINGSSVVITAYTGDGGHVSLPEAILDKQVTGIGDYAFYSCINLTGIQIPDGVTSIGNRAFYGCRDLADITIPNSVGSIGDFAFCACTSLPEIALPSNLFNIGSAAFSCCTRFTNVVIPSSVTRIERGTFSGCTSLASIAIPNSVTHIGTDAFSGCTSLMSITIPYGVTGIGDYAFAGCADLTSVFFAGNAPMPPPYGLFIDANQLTIYFREGTTHWGDSYGGQPTRPWKLSYHEWTQAVGLHDKYPVLCSEENDPDQDGLNNLQEMQAGTDPADPVSVLKFESMARSNDLEEGDKTSMDMEHHALFIQTVPGRKYEIQSMAAFGGAWQAETNVTATTTQKRIVVDKPVDQGFYRVVLVP